MARQPNLPATINLRIRCRQSTQTYLLDCRKHLSQSLHAIENARRPAPLPPKKHKFKIKHENIGQDSYEHTYIYTGSNTFTRHEANTYTNEPTNLQLNLEIRRKYFNI